MHDIKRQLRLSFFRSGGIVRGIVRRFFQGCLLPPRRLENCCLIQIPQVHDEVIGM